MLSVEDLAVSYGHVEALRGCSLNVPQGGIVTLLGANGAGKTTLLHAVAGLIRPLSGRISFEGNRISGRDPASIVSLGISLVPEHRQLFSAMTVAENLLLGAYSRGMRRDGLKAVYGLFPELAERCDIPAAMLSGGQQQMLAIGRGLMAQPRLLLLDEPSLGLAPMLVDRVLDALREINARGTTILLVEQNAYRAMALSQMTYVLENGAIAIYGLSADLLHDPRVQNAYLGTL
jgi:branched-chain amino acid transport system ATP-binding protein